MNATIGENSWVIDTTQFPDGEYTLEILVNNTNGEEVEEVYTVTIQNTIDTTTTIEDDGSEGTTAEESDTTSNTSIGNVTDGFTIIPMLAIIVVLSVLKKRY